MKKAYVFPGQGAQFSGMGHDLYQSSPAAKALFDKADEVLGFKISEIMLAAPTKSCARPKLLSQLCFSTR